MVASFNKLKLFSLKENMMSRPVYDDQNIFARILRGEVPCDKIDECSHTLSFADIQPQAPVHILVIPKGPYVDIADFAAYATAEEQVAFVAALGRAAQQAGLAETGFRLIANTGQNGHQDVPHLHMHILGGEPLGPMRPR